MDAIYLTRYEEELVLDKSSCNKKDIRFKEGRKVLLKKINSEKLHNDFTHFDSLSKIC